MPRKLVLNLADFYLGQFPFINFMKTAVASIGPTDLSVLNANNYPTTTMASGILFNPCKIPSSYTGNWIIDWQGNIGNAGYQFTGVSVTVVSGGAFVVGSSGNFTVKGNNGRVVFSFNSPQSLLTVQLLGGSAFSNFSNLRFYRADQEAALTAGEIFNPDFIAQLLELRAQAADGDFVLRFLDWSPANGGTLQKYEYITPPNAISYKAEYWAPGAWVGNITGTDTYACGNAPDSNPVVYVDGEVIQGYFTNANTSTAPTLNRNSLGAKTIVISSGAAVAVGELAANGRRTFVYNAFLDKFVTRSGNEGLQSVVPISVIIALCNKIGASCWLTMPLLFSAAAWGQLASAMRDGLDSDLSFVAEVANEVWNFQNQQTSMSIIMGALLGFAVPSEESLLSFHGLKTRQVAPSIRSGWSPRSSGQLKVVLAGQAVLPSLSDTYKIQGKALASVRTGTATITIASSGKITVNAINLANGNKVVLSTTGALPTGLSVATDYYVVNNNTVDGTANLSATPGGAAINTSGSQSGAHTATYTNLLYQSLIGVDYNVAPNRPVDYCEVLSYATYYQGANIQAFDANYTALNIAPLLTAADDYNGGNTTTALDWVDANIRGAGSETLTYLVANEYTPWQALAATYSKTIMCYEGGLQIVAPSTGMLISLGIDPAYSAKIATLINAYKFDARCRTLAFDQFTQQNAVSPGCFPAWYYFCFGVASQWSTHLNDLNSAKFMTYYAIVDWNSNPAPPMSVTTVPIPSPPGNKILTIGGITGR